MRRACCFVGGVVGWLVWVSSKQELVVCVCVWGQGGRGWSGGKDGCWVLGVMHARLHTHV